MKTSMRVPFALAVCLTLSVLMARGVEGQTVAELDGFWAEISRTVEDGDFDGYSALYHPDAALVSTSEGTSYPISEALVGWEQLFVDTRSGAADAKVSFRFSRRLHDGNTAHETGIFNYSFHPISGQIQNQYVHFQAFLVKKAGSWKMVMEYQLSPATAEEWEALH